MAEENGGSNNLNNRKKALVVSVLAFLLTGGSVFLFFVIQGSRDLTGANKRGAFTYGGAAREGAASFFKFIGFDDVESITSGGTKDRIREKEYEAAGLLDTLAPAETPAQEEAIPWGRPSASGRAAAPSNIPKMGGGTAGLGAAGGGGTRSSGGAARFADGTGAGNTKITSAARGGEQGAPGKGSLASLASARAMLGEGLRSGSASTAKAKWDSSFGMGRSAGGGSEMAYAKSGLVGLDKIKKGEVDNLKTTDVKSLKTPEVGAPVKDKEAEAKDTAAQKAKEAVQDAVAKSMASSMAGALGQGINSSGSDSGSGTDRGGSDPTVSGECGANSTSPLCQTAMKSSMPTDTNVSYQQIGRGEDGRPLMRVDYAGLGPGITDALKGQDVAYNDSCTVAINMDGTVEVLNWAKPVEKPVGTGG